MFSWNMNKLLYICKAFNFHIISYYIPHFEYVAWFFDSLNERWGCRATVRERKKCIRKKHNLHLRKPHSKCEKKMLHLQFTWWIINKSGIWTNGCISVRFYQLLPIGLRHTTTLDISTPYFYSYCMLCTHINVRELYRYGISIHS